MLRWSVLETSAAHMLHSGADFRVVHSRMQDPNKKDDANRQAVVL